MIRDIMVKPCAALCDDIKSIAINEFFSCKDIIIKRALYVPEIELVFSVHRLWQVVIHFTATGFYRLFGIAPAIILKEGGEELIRKECNGCYNEIQELMNDGDIICLVQNYMLSRKERETCKGDCNAISNACELLINSPGQYSMLQLASRCNMSLKTFQRKFLEYTGMLPKLFERVYRFQRIIEKKMAEPSLTWTELCYDAGYFDQTHMIKDFYSFAGSCPSEFFMHYSSMRSL